MLLQPEGPNSFQNKHSQELICSERAQQRPKAESRVAKCICDPSRENEPYGNCEKYRPWSTCSV